MKTSSESGTEIWDVIGLPSRGPELYRALHDGLPFSVYLKLSKLADVDRRELARAARISRSTLKRRAEKGQFTLAEGDRLYRFAELLAATTELFEGDRTKARDWMLEHAQGLGGKRPIEMIATTAETFGVLDFIGRIEHGVIE